MDTTQHRPLKFKAWDPHGKTMTHDPRILIRLDGTIEFEALKDRLAFGSPDVVIIQYTGLHDTAGNELWEGDIRGYKDDPSLFVVTYRNGACRAYYGIGDDGFPIEPIIAPFHLEHSIPMGNTYEHPHLALRLKNASDVMRTPE
jgi:hypothetical protein